MGDVEPIEMGAGSIVKGEYTAAVLDWIDGDTAIVELRLFRGLRLTSHLRLYGINAPEMRGPTRDKGLVARTFAGVVAVAQLDGKGPLVNVSYRGEDKYGRILGDIRTKAGIDVARALIESGHAVLWNGLGPRP